MQLVAWWWLQESLCVPWSECKLYVDSGEGGGMENFLYFEIPLLTGMLWALLLLVNGSRSEQNRVLLSVFIPPEALALPQAPLLQSSPGQQLSVGDRSSVPPLCPVLPKLHSAQPCNKHNIIQFEYFQIYFICTNIGVTDILHCIINVRNVLCVWSARTIRPGRAPAACYHTGHPSTLLLRCGPWLCGLPFYLWKLFIE